MPAERHGDEPNSGPKSVPRTPGKLAQANARDRRLAEQLRANLKRRKARGRDGRARDTDPGTGEIGE